MEPDAPVEVEKNGKGRKKGRVRAAWISFGGRIVAHLVGAAATVALGLMLAHQLRRAESQTVPAPAPAAPPLAHVPARMGGESIVIAVLPLQNFTGDGGQDHLADGLTEALIADLAEIRGLHVISRTSVMQFKDTRKPLPQIARELGVDLALEGSVVRSPARVRVTAQLLDAAHDRHLWAKTYDHAPGDPLALQDDVSTAIAREVSATLLSARGPHRSAARPPSHGAARGVLATHPTHE